MTTADKKAIRERLRSLRGELKAWTLKAPGLHAELTVVCHEHRKPIPACEACCFVLFRTEKADQIRGDIRALTDQLNGTPAPKPETTRKATVITGRGEQLVMFV